MRQIAYPAHKFQALTSILDLYKIYYFRSSIKRFSLFNESLFFFFINFQDTFNIQM